MAHEIVEVDYRVTGKDERSYQWHTHEGVCEIIQIWSDDGTVLIRDKVYQMSAGTVFLINGIENHCTSPGDAESYQRSKIVLSYDFMKRLADVAGLSDIIYRAFESGESACVEMPIDWCVEADGIFKKMRAAYEFGDEHKFAKMSVLLIELLIILSSHKNRVKTTESSRLEEIVRYINNHLCEEITIDDICRHMSISKYYLCHMFKKEANLTISQYVLQRRLSLARRRLIDTSDTISEVATKSGFTSFSYFSRVFREVHGCSPREFRTMEHRPEYSAREERV